MYKPAYECPKCKIDPSSHSLKKLGEKFNVEYYYTCPAEATLYYDEEGIYNHYNGVLNDIPEENKWVWVFDSSNFGLKHLMYINIGITLSTLLSTKYSHNLQKIIIINPNMYVSITYNIVKFFLSDYIKSIIEFDNEVKDAKYILSRV